MFDFYVNMGIYFMSSVKHLVTNWALNFDLCFFFNLMCSLDINVQIVYSLLYDELTVNNNFKFTLESGSKKKIMYV